MPIEDGETRFMRAGDESILLAKMLFAPEFMTAHAERITASLFSTGTRQSLARLALERHKQGQAIDAAAIAQELFTSGESDEKSLAIELKECGDCEVFGDERAIQAIDKLHHAANMDRLSGIVEDARQEIGNPDPLADPHRIMGEMQERFMSLQPTTVSKPITLADLMKTDVSEESDPIMATGLEWFDKAIGGGFQQGDKLFIGGAPGVGKTTLGLQLTCSFLETHPESTAVWCAGEMRLTKLRNRVLMMMSDLAIGVLRRPWDDEMLSTFQADQKRSAIERMEWMADRLSFIESPLSIPAIESRIIATKPALVVIDYLQLVRVQDAANRRDEVDQVVREICRLAQHYGTAFYVISDEGKNGEPNKPRTIHTAFKESSEIEHAADYCFYGYTPDAEPDKDPPAIVDVKWQSLKARDGERRSIWTRFDKTIQKFQGIEP